MTFQSERLFDQLVSPLCGDDLDRIRNGSTYHLSWDGCKFVWIEDGSSIILCDQGYFASEAALVAALPVGQPCWHAVVGDTDTIWVRDTLTNTWVDTGISTPTEQTPEVFIAVNGQTLFVLPNVPSDPTATKVFVNGAYAIQGIHYTLAGDTITWLGTPTMVAGWLVTVHYS